MEKLSVIDLFAGAGGLSYGFLQTKCFDIKVAVECNKHAQDTYEKNHLVKTIELDIKDLNYKKLIDDYGPFDIVIGGPPCQGFSNANRQKNELVSGSNQLINEYIKAVEELQSMAFVMENVKTINSDKHKFFCCKEEQKSVEALDVVLNEEIIPIAEAMISPEEFINFLQTSSDLLMYVLSKDNYIKINTILRNAKSNEQLIKYLNKYEVPITKLLNTWDKLHIGFCCDEYKKIFCKTKQLLENYIFSGQGFDELKSGLNAIVETQKAIYKMQEIKENKIDLLDMKHEKRNICIIVKTYSVIDYVIKKFRSLGYIICSGVLNAAQFGVPQNRERFIIIGIKNDSLKAEEVKLPSVIISSPEEYYTIGEAIVDLADYKTSISTECEQIQRKDNIFLNTLQAYLANSEIIYNHVITDTKETALKRFKMLEPGQNFHDLDESYKTTYSDPTRTQKTIYQRLDYKVPSGTVLNVRKSMWIHPTQDRAISIREAARLQSFPDSFVFYGTKDSQYQQIGNAVPPLLGRAIAEKVLELLGINPAEKLTNIIKRECSFDPKTGCASN